MMEWQEKSERFSVFIGKLRQRALELEAEVGREAQSVYDEDADPYKRAYLNFKNGISGQFQAMLTKAKDVFESQILPLRDKYDDMAFQQEYSKLYAQQQDFENFIYGVKKRVFDNVKEISAEKQLEEILAEYRQIKNSFACTQCGAPLEVNQLYFVSTYITCPFCKTQNTFIPGSKMKTLPLLAREVGEERHRDLLREYEHIMQEERNSLVAFWAYFKYRAFVWLEKSKIVPALRQENLLVFYREITDQMEYNGFSWENDSFQQYIFGHLGFDTEQLPNISNEERSRLKELSLFVLQQWQAEGLALHYIEPLITKLNNDNLANH